MYTCVGHRYTPTHHVHMCGSQIHTHTPCTHVWVTDTHPHTITRTISIYSSSKTQHQFLGRHNHYIRRPIAWRRIEPVRHGSRYSCPRSGLLTPLPPRFCVYRLFAPAASDIARESCCVLYKVTIGTVHNANQGIVVMIGCQARIPTI